MIKTSIVILLFLTLVLASSKAYTQQQVLSFEVLNAESYIPLDNAQIAITPCSCGGVTDASGRFSINLSPGEYTAAISYVGFATQNVEVNLKVGEVMFSSLAIILEMLLKEEWRTILQCFFHQFIQKYQ